MADTSLVVWSDMVRKQIDRLRVTYPELNDDADLLLGMVEGSTSFERVIDMVLDAFLDRVTMREAITRRIETMEARAHRMDRGAEALRDLARSLVEAAGQTTVKRPLATLVLSKGRPKLELDEDFNAQGYMRVKTEPMKADIAAALAAGSQIPGARLVEGEPTFSIRTK
jgi:hypothetical protein